MKPIFIKLVILASLVLSSQVFPELVFAKPGEIDTTFGSEGKVITDFSGESDYCHDLKIDNSGRILVAGGTRVGGITKFALARYNSNGSLDTTFGVNGKVITDITSVNSYGIFECALQPDGKIVAVGTKLSDDRDKIAVVRYNSDGSLDTSFGGSGTVIVSLTGIASDFSKGGEYGLAITLDRKGKIVVAAPSLIPPSTSSIAVFRFNTDGTMDKTLGVNGKVITNISENKFNVPKAIKIDKDDKIVVGGFTGKEIYNHKTNFMVARFNNNGNMDTSFGDGGFTTIEFKGGVDNVNTMAIQRDGKIVIGGDVQVGSFGNLRKIDFGIARLNSNGSPDASFGKDGKQITSFTIPGQSSLQDITIQSDGKIIAAGGANARDSAVARYNSDGSLDRLFGDNGIKVTPFYNSSTWEAVGIQSDGKIVLGGYVGNGKQSDFAVIRYN